MVCVNVPVLFLLMIRRPRRSTLLGDTALFRSEQVAPDGQPVTVRPTLPLNPFSAVTVIVEVPDPPCVSVSDVGLRDIEKSGTDATLKDGDMEDPWKGHQLDPASDAKNVWVLEMVES